MPSYAISLVAESYSDSHFMRAAFLDGFSTFSAGGNADLRSIGRAIRLCEAFHNLNLACYPLL